MADLVVQPAYQFEPTDIVTVDKLNLLGTPLVSLAIETPVTDENYLRNGNFYSSFWANAAGISCPVGVETQNANYWTVNPNGAAVSCKRSTDVPDLYSLWSLEIDGATGTTDCSLGQQINGDLSATLRRPCTFSGYIENNSGALLSPTLEIWTANVFNNFNAVTLQTTVNLQTVPNSQWGYVNTTIDLSASTLANVANGLLLKVRLPSGTLSTTTKRINFSRLKFQQGELATEFSDDPSLFIEAPSVDSTMLQDGCLARSSLYVTNPGVIPQGAFAPGAIHSADIGVGRVEGINLDPGISTTTAANFTVPAVNVSVPITMTSATGISAGLVFNVAGAGSYSTVSVAGNIVTATNTGATGNASPGAVINSGAAVTTSGNAVVGCLGYTPIDKDGDTGIGILEYDLDTSVNASAPQNSGVYLNGTSANANNDTTFPSIGFNRPSVIGRAIGLSTTGRFKTVDTTGVIGYLLDTVTGVDTNSYQAGSITLQALAQSLINVVIPAGMVRMFAGPTPPSGWLICDGTQYLQSQWPGLFAAIGTYWGGGGAGASAWFQVPDLRGRSPIGYVNSPVGGITGRGFATLGGEEVHALAQAEMPSHTHVVTDNGHAHFCEWHDHTYRDPGHSHSVFAGGGINVSGGAGNIAQGIISANTSTNQTGITFQGQQIQALNAPANVWNQNTGGNGSHNNMQPFAVMYFIIKT